MTVFELRNLGFEIEKVDDKNIRLRLQTPKDMFNLITSPFEIGNGISDIEPNVLHENSNYVLQDAEISFITDCINNIIKRFYDKEANEEE